MAIILKVWRQVENPTSSVDGYLLEKQNNPAKFRPDPVLNDVALGFFVEVAPNNKKNNNKMSSDIGSVPDPKIVQRLSTSDVTAITRDVIVTVKQTEQPLTLDSQHHRPKSKL